VSREQEAFSDLPRMKQLILFSILLGLCYLQVDAKVVTGRLDTERKWQYVTKFAFHPGEKLGENNYTTMGILQFNFTNYNTTAYKPSIYFYLYEALNKTKSWPDIYSNVDSWTCEELTGNASSWRRAPIDDSTTTAGFQRFGQQFPRYWFFAIADCQSPNGLHLDYDLTLLNTDSDWGRHVSYDQQDLPGLYLFYFFIYFFGVAVHAWGMYNLWRSDFLHPVVKLLSATIAIYSISIFSAFIHWMAYHNNGRGSPFLNGTSEFFDFTSQVLLTLLLLLIAKGWAISNTEVKERNIVAGVIAVFIILYFSTFLFAWTRWDPASTLYIYETAPGIVILVFRALTLIYFIYSLRFGVLHESHPSKRRFYQIFAAVYTAWFLSLHLIVIVAAIRDPEERIRTVVPFYVTVQTLALAVLAFLFWPSQIVKYFDVRPSEGLLTGSSSSPYETL